jgi:damage-control phosphatase, subfamily II, stand-alone protein
MTTKHDLIAANPRPGLPADIRPLPLLADVASYRSCTWDLLKQTHKRAYWLQLFRWHFPKLVEEALSDAADRGHDRADTTRRIAQAQRDFEAYLDALDAQPDRFGAMDIIEICYARERVLREYNFDDPYRLAKRRANESAMPMLQPLLAALDAMDELTRLDALTRGVFAGNIFDLGATKTVDLYKGGSKVDFHSVLAKLKPRPWVIDGFDAWINRLTTGPRHRCALLFVDNAGCDIVLGMIPLARELLRRGSCVVLTSNTFPSLNDVTHEELSQMIRDIAKWDDVTRNALTSGQLELVPSGNGAPLIDLSRVSQELVEATNRRGVDLVILEGMGRGVESNLYAKLTCDTLKIALIKDEGVAESLGGSLYDPVLRFDLAPLR